MNAMQTCNSVTQFRHVLLHEKTHFLILAGSVFCQKMILAPRLTALIIFWQNTLPADIRKLVFSGNKRDGIT